MIRYRVVPKSCALCTYGPPQDHVNTKLSHAVWGYYCMPKNKDLNMSDILLEVQGRASTQQMNGASFYCETCKQMAWLCPMVQKPSSESLNEALLEFENEWERSDQIAKAMAILKSQI